mmetsp:Transcript_22174/g.50759  ORF Transcript_22174/g.50759 Transcript_22174/m.50759 type:complete len:380 (-) Transcript_22174:103-1242(-)
MASARNLLLAAGSYFFNNGNSSTSLSDILTFRLPLLSVDYHIARCHLTSRVDVREAGGFRRRLANVDRARYFLRCFLENLIDNLRVSEEELNFSHCHGFECSLAGGEVTDEYRRLVMLEEEDEGEDEGDGGVQSFVGFSMSAGKRRENKIARFQFKRSLEVNRARMKALLERSKRLGMENGDDDESQYSEDTLTRESNLLDLAYNISEAVENWGAILEERAMLLMSVKREKMASGTNHTQNGFSLDGRRRPAPFQPTPPSFPLQLTHISQRPDGSVQMSREEIMARVFRPSWNQPTMSLQEYAEKQVSEAVKREAMLKGQEKEAKLQPRRYEQLVKDGMEDNAKLVEASSDLDRKWDMFREENPRGSGNKRGEQGDRNF